MCKRKIKTVKVLLSLLLFAAVMFQIPSDVHAQVETMTTKPALCSKAVSYSSAAKASAAKKATATFRSSKTTLWVGHKVTMRSPYHSEGRHQPEYQKRKIQQTICSGSFRKLSGPKSRNCRCHRKIKRRQPQDHHYCI